MYGILSKSPPGMCVYIYIYSPVLLCLDSHGWMAQGCIWSIGKISGKKDNMKKETMYRSFLAGFQIHKREIPAALILSLLTVFSKSFLTTVINTVLQLLPLQFTSLFLSSPKPKHGKKYHLLSRLCGQNENPWSTGKKTKEIVNELCWGLEVIGGQDGVRKNKGNESSFCYLRSVSFGN